MISTAIQLKAKVRNLSKGDSTKAQTLIRNSSWNAFLSVTKGKNPHLPLVNTDLEVPG